MSTLIIAPPLGTETPIGALTSLNIGDYDRVIADFKKKRAAQDATKAKLARLTEELKAAEQKCLEVSNKLAETLDNFVKIYPAIEAREFAREFERLESAEQLISDGVSGVDVEKLVVDFFHLLEKVKVFNKTMKSMARTITVIKSIDSRLGARIARTTGEVGRIGNRMIVHYRDMCARARTIAAKAKVGKLGPAAEAARFYREAWARIDGVRDVGELRADVRHLPPLYELPVSIDPVIFNDRRRLRDLIRDVDNYVDERDPSLVGLITFRFEPILGAA